MNTYKELLRAQSIIALLDENDPDIDAILETETEVFELIDWALRKDLEYIARIEMNKTLAASYKEREALLKKRQASIRGWLTSVMEAINKTKHQGAYGTVSIGTVARKPVIIDIEKLPDECVKNTKTPIMAEVKERLEKGELNGAGWSNGGQKITIRRK